MLTADKRGCAAADGYDVWLIDLRRKLVTERLRAGRGKLNGGAGRRSPDALLNGARPIAAGDVPDPSYEDARTRSAAFSATAMTVALMLPDGTAGMTEASTTRIPSRPRTRS